MDSGCKRHWRPVGQSQDAGATGRASWCRGCLGKLGALHSEGRACCCPGNLGRVRAALRSAWADPSKHTTHPRHHDCHLISQCCSRHPLQLFKTTVVPVEMRTGGRRAPASPGFPAGRQGRGSSDAPTGASVGSRLSHPAGDLGILMLTLRVLIVVSVKWV